MTSTDSSGDGETFSATAVMTSTGKVDVGVPVGDVEWTDDIVCPCPACESGNIRADHRGYGCDQSTCKIQRLAHVRSQRTMTSTDALALYASGATDYHEDFISRWKKPFKARLILNGTKIEFEFPHGRVLSSSMWTSVLWPSILRPV